MPKASRSQDHVSQIQLLAIGPTYLTSGQIRQVLGYNEHDWKEDFYPKSRRIIEDYDLQNHYPKDDAWKQAVLELIQETPRIRDLGKDEVYQKQLAKRILYIKTKALRQDTSEAKLSEVDEVHLNQPSQELQPLAKNLVRFLKPPSNNRPPVAQQAQQIPGTYQFQVPRVSEEEDRFTGTEIGRTEIELLRTIDLLRSEMKIKDGVIQNMDRALQEREKEVDNLKEELRTLKSTYL